MLKVIAKEHEVPVPPPMMVSPSPGSLGRLFVLPLDPPPMAPPLPEVRQEERDQGQEEGRNSLKGRVKLLGEPSVMRAAWLAMPVAARDRIGTAAITHSFYSRLGRWPDRPLTLVAGQRCEDIQSAAFKDLEAAACAALPALYGTDEQPPRWEREDAVAAVCPVSEDASPLVSAIATHLKAEEELYA